MISNTEIEKSYNNCIKLAKEHYENFPVASNLLPKRVRKPIAAIYAFARIADDISDEGEDSAPIRIEKLNKLRDILRNISLGNDVLDAYFTALQHAIVSFNLPIELFFDLLDAFEQDVTKNIYDNFGEVLWYCQRSANPIGRLLLHLLKLNTDENIKMSDDLCTSFQLFNFIQDVESDLKKRNRCYIPQNLMFKYEISISDILNRTCIEQYRLLIDEYLQQAEIIFKNGLPLANNITGLFGLEIKATVVSIDIVIQMLKDRKSPYYRPTIAKQHIPKILLNTFLFNYIYKKASHKKYEPAQSILP